MEGTKAKSEQCDVCGKVVDYLPDNKRNQYQQFQPKTVTDKKY